MAGHDHLLTVPVTTGPLILRVGLLTAVPLVAGFGVLRAFLPEPGRFARGVVVVTAAATVLLELMLAGAELALPSQLMPLVVLALVAPVFMTLSRNPELERTIGRVALLAPAMISLTTGAALVEFARAFLGARTPESRAILLHTGVVLALVGLCWYVVYRPDGRLLRVVLQIEATVLAMAMLAGAAQATVLHPPYPPQPGAVAVRSVGVGATKLNVLVVPNEPGWNLVHVQAADVSVGPGPEKLVPAVDGWARVRLPAGRGGLWIGRQGSLGYLTTDTGGGPELADIPFDRDNAAECASAVLGARVAGGALTDCPTTSLSTSDAEALRVVLAHLRGQGVTAVTLVGDSSPRSLAAQQLVRGEGFTERPDGPLLVVSGWTEAATALAKPPAQGCYLAPWLLTPPLLEAAQARIALRATSGSDGYATAIGALTGEAPSSTGHDAWLAARKSTVDLPPRLYAVAAIPGRSDLTLTPAG